MLRDIIGNMLYYADRISISNECDGQPGEAMDRARK
jgi:hypothetical protein